MFSNAIFDAWDKIKDDISILQDNITDRLDALGFDNETYKDGSNQEIEKILALANTLAAIHF